METMRDIALRLKSVASTRQITESMRLIATRKVQKLKVRMEQNRPYLEHYAEVARTLAALPQFAAHPYVSGRPDGRALVLVITGDRGLCGGYNINAEKAAAALISELGDVRLITVGSKGRDFFRRTGLPLVEAFKGMSEEPFYKDARQVAELALGLYDSRAVDAIHLVYTRYDSMLSQTPCFQRLLPLEPGPDGPDAQPVPDGEQLLEGIMVHYLAAVLFGAMLTSTVSEQCARVTGMNAAAENSKKITDSLTLLYNQTRQGAITQEIAEIVGGANATERPGS